jgi:replication factor A1
LKYLPEVDPASFPLIEFTPASKIETLETTDLKIRDIDARVKWVNLIARVVGKSNPRNLLSRFGQSLALSIATISDGTGSMRLPLWNAQIDRVSVGDTVQIENGRVRAFRGELQVSVGRNSKLEVIRSNQHSKRAL